MRVLLHFAILTGALAAAAPLCAETYKWVDKNGVVNYSNRLPSATVTKAQLVEERISIVAPDPSVGWAIAAMRARAARQAQYDEADWQQRLRLMVARQASYPTTYGMVYDPYVDSFNPYYPYYAPLFAVGAGRRSTPGFMHTSSFSIGGTHMAHSVRGGFSLAVRPPRPSRQTMSPSKH